MASPSTRRRVADQTTVPSFEHSYATCYLACACMLARFSVVCSLRPVTWHACRVTTSTPPARMVRATVTSDPCAGLSVMHGFFSLDMATY
jgi:hypothetical protein